MARLRVGGQARFTAVGLGGGNHVAGALYGGDANVLVSSSSAQAFTVVASRPVTGSHVGSLVVAPGSTVLLVHADLIGSVVVLPGGGVDIEGSTILGSVTADRPRAVRVCASTIGGALNIDRPQGFVVVGPPGVGCASNSVRGAQRKILPSAKHAGQVGSAGSRPRRVRTDLHRRRVAGRRRRTWEVS